MPADQQTVTIRSYRLAFQLERRIHRIDRFRVPLPYGLPLRTLAYAAAVFAAVLLASALPVVGVLADALPWSVRDIVIPGAAAQLLARLDVDGRPAHEVVAHLVRAQFEPRRRVALAAAPRRGPHVIETIVLAPDERGPRYRRGRVDGPGDVILRQPAEAEPRGNRLVVTQTDDRPLYRGRRVCLQADQRVEVA